MSGFWPLLLLGVAGFLWFLVPFAWRRMQERELAARCSAARAIVLSYDDGPGAVLTPALLDLLEARQVRASFFMLGDRIAERPDTVRRLVEAGHDLGSHSEKHLNAWFALPWAVSRDVKAGMRTVVRAGGRPTLFRPPYGKVTLGGLLQAWRNNIMLCWWTVDTRDSWARRPTEDVLAEIKAKGGGVVLMHDYDSYDHGSDPVSHVDHVLGLSSRILDFAREGGFRVLTVSELQGVKAREELSLA